MPRYSKFPTRLNRKFKSRFRVRLHTFRGKIHLYRIPGSLQQWLRENMSGKFRMYRITFKAHERGYKPLGVTILLDNPSDLFLVTFEYGCDILSIEENKNVEDQR